MIRRVYVAHMKSLTDADLAEFVDRIRTAFAGRKLKDGSPLEVEITTGRQSAKAWEDAHHGLPFNWGAWTEHVVGTTAPFNGEPRFHYFVAGPSKVVGRATHGLLKAALLKGRQVLYLDPETAKFQSVGAVVQMSENNWKAGWVLLVRAA